MLGSIDNLKVYPSLLRTSRNAQGELTFLNGMARAECIKHLPVFDIMTKNTMALAECGELYSTEWDGPI